MALRPGFALAITVLAVVALSVPGTAVVVLATGTQLWAAPADPEGGSKQLRDTLDSANRAHVEAKNRLTRSRKAQAQHQARLTQARQSAARLETRVVALAAESYRVGRLSGLTMLLNSSSPDAFLERAVRLDMMAQLDAQTLTGYRVARDAAAAAEKAAAREVRLQQAQVAVMARKKTEAERALATVGGTTTGGFVGAGSRRAAAADRDADGSFSRERCGVPDPTSGGCITPRLLHALEQARAAGFRRYTGCYSARQSGDHPRGRACDFSAAPGGFENVAARGGDRTYGDNLAAFLVRNADELGVSYVIWYRQIWSSTSGWRAYGRRGAPNVAHTNHVHLSVL